ncbi:MAG: serine/threonine protein kinase [Myxococcaceae bacterium]|nr:serine/threonine protein kinase [Myxococcaceae bacterium]
MPGTDTTARGRLTGASTVGPIICTSCAKVLEGEPNFCDACGTDLRGLGAGSDTLSGLEKEKIIDGRYRLLEKLGEGGMGSVYKVEHVRMGKIAALKVMRPDAAVDKGLKARFLQESRVVAKLSHPNTVQVFDAGELDDGSLFMAMEYVPGKDLAWHLRVHGPVGEEKAISIAVQVLASLAEAHEHGIIHRDIKPANVMLLRRRKGGDDQVKLLDFGIAKLAEGDARNSITGDFVGTPAYMSPEQVRGEEVDARSDLYSLGALLFELVTGRQLYTGPTAVSIVKQHLEEPVPRVAELAPHAPVSPAFEKIISTALAKKPDDRFKDAEVMKKALEALRTSTRSVTSDFTPMPDELAAKMLSREDFDRYERRLRSERLLAPVATLLVLIALAVGGWRALQHLKADEGPASVEQEPNDQIKQANRIALGSPVKGAMGAAAEGEGDRDLYVVQLPTGGSYRLSLSAVHDLNLTLEVLQIDQLKGDDGPGDAGTATKQDTEKRAEKLRRRLFLDDVGPSEAERVDGLELMAGPVYLRVEERPWCSEPNRPPREKSLVQYSLAIEPMPAGDGFFESEPNDSALTAAPLPLTRAVTGWTGARLDELDRLTELRPDAPFSSADVWKIEAVPPTEQVVVAIVPPERGALVVVDQSEVDAWRQRKAQSSPSRPAPPPPPPLIVRGTPQLLGLSAGPDGLRRVRVVAGEGALPGSAYQLAAATTGPNGVAGLLDLLRTLEGRPASQAALLDGASTALKRSPELARLLEARRPAQ